jgi:hypothetical protein
MELSVAHQVRKSRDIRVRSTVIAKAMSLQRNIAHGNAIAAQRDSIVATGYCFIINRRGHEVGASISVKTVDNLARLTSKRSTALKALQAKLRPSEIEALPYYKQLERVDCDRQYYSCAMKMLDARYATANSYLSVLNNDVFHMVLTYVVHDPLPKAARTTVQPIVSDISDSSSSSNDDEDEDVSDK